MIGRRHVRCIRYIVTERTCVGIYVSVFRVLCPILPLGIPLDSWLRYETKRVYVGVRTLTTTCAQD